MFRLRQAPCCTRLWAFVRSFALARLCLSLAPILSAFAALCCSGAKPPDLFAQYQHQTWGREEGLPDLWVNAILQTRDGFLWAATRGGLVRYDGQSFKVFDRANTPAFTTDEITALAEDTDGSLWIGTADGLIHFKNRRFIRFDMKEEWRSHRILCMAPGRCQAVWVGTRNELWWIERESDHATRFSGSIPSNYFTALQADAEGTLWAGTEEGLLRVRERTGAMLGDFEKPSKGTHLVKRLTLDPNGVLWGLFDEGDFKFSLFRREKAGEWTRRFEGDFSGGYRDVTTFFQMDRRKAWWFATADNKVIQFRDRVLASLQLPFADPMDRILSGCVDREGNIWIGTKFSGLWRLRFPVVQTISAEEGLPAAPARVVCPARDGSLWIGTDAGLSHYANGSCVNYTKADGLSRNDVRALAEDASGTLWVGAGFGLNSFKNGKFTLHLFNGPYARSEPPGAGWNKIRAVLSARDGSLWVGTARGLHRLIDGQDQFFTTNQLTHQDVRGLMQDRAGDIWIATYGGGIDRCHDGRFSALTVTNGLSSNHCWAVLEDSCGAVWIAAEGGLNRFSHGRRTLFSTRDGLLENQVNQLLEDHLGSLWLGGDLGLSRVALSDFAAVADHRAKLVHPRRYGQADGMVSSLTSGGAYQPSASEGRDGRLYFANARGVAAIDPAFALAEAPPPPPVVIQRVLLGDRIIYGDDAESPPPTPPSAVQPLVVPPGQGRALEFQFAANSFLGPSRVRYKFRLEGYSDLWTDAGERRFAYFTSVPPGRYRFHVIAADHHNLWNETGATLDIRLFPYIHQTWWFPLATLAAVMAAIAALVRWRMRELAALHDAKSESKVTLERLRIGRDLHEEVGSGLAQIQYMVSLAEQKAAQPNELARNLAEIARVTRTVSAGLRGVIWVAQPDGGTLESLVSRLTTHVEFLFDRTGLEYEFEIPDLPEAQIGFEANQQVFLAAKEALANALRHSGASRVVLRCVVTKKAFEIAIEDNGRGLPASPSLGPRPGGGNGLPNMRSRIEEIGGALTLASINGCGTKVRLTIPLRPADSSRAAPNKRVR